MKRRTLLPALLSPWLVHAQSAKPQAWIVPFPAGGGTDAFARPLTAMLTRQMGRQVLIDNKGGAGGTVGAGIAAKLAPDGNNFFMGAVHHTIAPSMYPKLDYRLEDDFIPVALLASATTAVSRPSRPASSTEAGPSPPAAPAPAGPSSRAWSNVPPPRRLHAPRTV